MLLPRKWLSCQGVGQDNSQVYHASEVNTEYHELPGKDNTERVVHLLKDLDPGAQITVLDVYLSGG